MAHTSRSAAQRQRSQLPLEVAMANKAVTTRRRSLMQKVSSPKPFKNTPKAKMIRKAKTKKLIASMSSQGRAGYGGYDRWGKSQ